METKLSLKPKYKGRIVDVYYDVSTFGYAFSGIKRDQQPEFDSRYYGSNGSYAGISVVNNCLYLKVVVYDLPEAGKSITIDCDERDFLLKRFNRINVTEKFVSTVSAKLKGKKITIHYKDPDLCKEEEDYYQLDKDELSKLLNGG